MLDITLTNLIIHSAQNALSDLWGILPFLFAIFVIVELVEFFFFDKISSFAKSSGKFGPLAGALLASFPQCGFSVIASILYIRGFITRGTLIAVYISTSDEAIPVLLSMPDKYSLVLPLIAIKILCGISAGYLVDFLFAQKKQSLPDIEEEKGCCEHSLSAKDKKDLLLHPIFHTINISVFIFIVTFLINLFIMRDGNIQTLGGVLAKSSFFQPVIAAFMGLIPNCAISVALALLYLKGSISFASALSGLCSSAGLGIWIILKKNPDKKDSAFIILLLVSISAAIGLVFFFISKFI